MADSRDWHDVTAADLEPKAGPSVVTVCGNCPDGEFQTYGVFQWFHFYFTLSTVFDLLENNPREPIPISREHARAWGLVIDQEEIGSNRIRLGMRSINEAHLDHIPEEKLNTPGIVGPIVVGTERLSKASGKSGGRESHSGPEASWLLIDGGHRLTKLFRAGAETALVYPLTAQEMIVAQGQTMTQAANFIVKHKAAFKDWPADIREIAGVGHLFSKDE